MEVIDTPQRRIMLVSADRDSSLVLFKESWFQPGDKIVAHNYSNCTIELGKQHPNGWFDVIDYTGAIMGNTYYYQYTETFKNTNEEILLLL